MAKAQAMKKSGQVGGVSGGAGGGVVAAVNHRSSIMNNKVGILNLLKLTGGQDS